MSSTSSPPPGALLLSDAFAKWSADKYGCLPTEQNKDRAFWDHRKEFTAEIARGLHEVYACDRYPFGEWKPLGAHLFQPANRPDLNWRQNSFGFNGNTTIIRGVWVVLDINVPVAGNGEKRGRPPKEIERVKRALLTDDRGLETLRNMKKQVLASELRTSSDTLRRAFKALDASFSPNLGAD